MANREAPAPGDTQPSNGNATLIGVVGAVDRVAGAENAYWLISTGLRERLGFDLVQVCQLPPSNPLADDRELHVLRPDGRRGLLGLQQLFGLRRVRR